MPDRLLRSGAPTDGRRVVTGRRLTFTGYVPSAKPENDFRLIAYESLLERDYIMHLEADRSIASYRDRDIALDWTDEGGVDHLWHPDFTLCTVDDRRICVEVKPWAVIRRKGLLPIYRQIGAEMRSRHGFHDFRLVTDREIREPYRLYNLEILHSARLARTVESDFMAVRRMMLEASPTTVGALRRRMGEAAPGFWSVCRIVADGSAVLDDPLMPIEDRAVIDWSEER